MLKAGAVYKTINCSIGDSLSGLFENRTCRFIQDDLEANLLYLEGEDNCKVLLISLDLLGTDVEFVKSTAAKIEGKTGIPAENICMFSSHTHAAPYAFEFIFDVPANNEYLLHLENRLLDGAMDAIEHAQPVLAGCEQGNVQIGYNRRLCWSNGTHTMYGDSSQHGFTGLEGPDDPSHSILALRYYDGCLAAIIHNNCCHATCDCGDDHVSADYPGEARRIIREQLGNPSLPVLYMQGASGDISPLNMIHRQNEPPSKILQNAGAEVAGETLRLLNLVDYSDVNNFDYRISSLNLKIRFPSAELLEKSKQIIHNPDNYSRPDLVLAHARKRIFDDFAHNPIERVFIAVVRINQFCAVFWPGEVYCSFGLDIKRRSCAQITAVAQLHGNSPMSYVPTMYAILGGGYSGEAIHWCRWEAEAGYKIVDQSSAMICDIFNKSTI